MADPFEVRVRFSAQLQNLNASVNSARKAAAYALKYRDLDEDLHSCILEQLEKTALNTRANIMYFIEPFLELAQREGHQEYISMVQRDIIRVVDAVAPEGGPGAANGKVVRRVLQGLQKRGFLDSQVVTQIEEVLRERELEVEMELERERERRQPQGGAGGGAGGEAKRPTLGSGGGGGGGGGGLSPGRAVGGSETGGATAREHGSGVSGSGSGSRGGGDAMDLDSRHGRGAHSSGRHHGVGAAGTATGAGTAAGAGAGAGVGVGTASEAGGGAHEAAGDGGDLTRRIDKRQIEQRIEEDRERHKRLRENIWAVAHDKSADAEMWKLWEETSDLGEDDHLMGEEEQAERERNLLASCLHRTATRTEGLSISRAPVSNGAV